MRQADGQDGYGGSGLPRQQSWTLPHILLVIAAFYGGLSLARQAMSIWKNREIPKAKAYIA